MTGVLFTVVNITITSYNALATAIAEPHTAEIFRTYTR